MGKHREREKLPRIDVLILSSLARAPMHGYEIKLELQYKHVRWWAKCEHGHLYAALKRLEKHGLLKGSTRHTGQRVRRVYKITAVGRRSLLTALRRIAPGEDATYFDIDLFFSSCFLLERDETLALLTERRGVLVAQLAQAEQLLVKMEGLVPVSGRVIMRHRIDFLTREIQFVDEAAEMFRAEPRWGSFLGDERIESFVARSGVPLEAD